MLLHAADVGSKDRAGGGLRHRAQCSGSWSSITPIAGQFAAFGRGHSLLKYLERWAKRLGTPPTIAAWLQMGLDLVVPDLGSRERATRKNHEDLVAIHRLSPNSKMSVRPCAAGIPNKKLESPMRFLKLLYTCECNLCQCNRGRKLRK